MDANTFPSAHDAIAWAVRRRNIPIIERSSVHAMGKKKAVFEWMPGLDAWEKLAEAVYIFKEIERTCTKLEMVVLETYYMGGTNELADSLAGKIGRELRRDKWFVADVLRQWARERPRHNLKWWSKKYKVHESTVRRWQGDVIDRLDIMLKASLTGADHALKESGHVDY